MAGVREGMFPVQQFCSNKSSILVSLELKSPDCDKLEVNHLNYFGILPDLKLWCLSLEAIQMFGCFFVDFCFYNFSVLPLRCVM